MGEAIGSIVNKDYVKLIERVSNIVNKISGNRLGEKQSYMIETRVKKRMMELSIKSADDYLKYLDSNLENESQILVGLITTHHTFFFREFPHFEILKARLPELLSSVKKRGDKVLNVWCSACSRGHEVYSLAMFLDFHIPQIDPSMTYKILGTDIDAESVKVASNGVYNQNEIKEIPMNYLGNNWAKGTGAISMYAKVKNSLKEKCEFKAGNLLKVSDVVKSEKFDVIFCRNVFIYFENQQIESISKDLISHLRPSGIYFTGISEPLSGLKLEIQSIGPSAYMHKAVSLELVKSDKVNSSPSTVTTKVFETETPAILKVFCVDDSPSILTLLKKVLTLENGFEVVGTALNGKDAMEKMKSLKFDLMTLDIHMPEMDGITYLEKNFTKTHPPVMIISSASRADSDTAMKALKFGACDYVEKPALTNLEERGEEIRTKLRSMASNIVKKGAISSFDKENQKQFLISNPETKMRIIFTSLASFPMLKNFFHDLDKSQPPSILFFEGQGEILEGLIKEYQSDFKMPLKYIGDLDVKIEPNTIYFADSKKYFDFISHKYSTYPTSILVYGSISNHSAKKMMGWKGCQILLEDLGEAANKKHPLMSVSTDVVPATSFAYMSCRYLSTK